MSSGYVKCGEDDCWIRSRSQDPHYENGYNYLIGTDFYTNKKQLYVAYTLFLGGSVVCFEM